MTKKHWLTVALLALACILAVLGVSKLVDYATGMKPGETYAPEETVLVDGHTLTYRASLPTDAYAPGTPVGDWIVGCSAPDRNEQVDGYVLRHDMTAGDMTTYTYLVYLPGETTDTAAPALFEGETYGYRLDLCRTAPTDSGYSLSRIEVTLPTEGEAPRLRVLVDGDTLGLLVTVSDTPIPAGT